jgi:hypothetical protein
VLSVLAFQVQAQKSSIEKEFNEKEAISHFRYLASDELMGRDPIRPEIDAAARYISEQFWKYGAQQIKGANGYYQNIPFRLSSPPSKGTVSLGSNSFGQGDGLLVLDGPSLSGKFEMIVVGYGQESDYEGIEVEGKIVVTNVGAPNRLSPADLFSAGRDKIALAKMIKYCQNDVILLEKVFKKMSTHIEPKTHYGVVFGEDRGSCGECGSDELVKQRTKVLASGIRKIQYQCKTCGKYQYKPDK